MLCGPTEAATCRSGGCVQALTRRRAFQRWSLHASSSAKGVVTLLSAHGFDAHRMSSCLVGSHSSFFNFFWVATV